MFAPVYLDYNATTPVLDEAVEAMLPWLRGRHGNPSSRHEYGRAALAALEQARQQVAAAVGAHPTEVIFTSGGTEANNLFLKGAAASGRPGGVVISSVEHPCVREPARQLQRQGWWLHELAVDAAGVVDDADYAAALARRPRLVSVMLANNETGVCQDVATLAAAARRAGAWLHSDAVQAFGKVPVDFRSLGVQGLTVSAHKIGGPQGIGALVIDKRVELQPLLAGGGQERGLRSGTENIAAIVGFGVAAQHVAERQAAHTRLRLLRDRLQDGVIALGATVFGADAPRLDNTLFCAFPGLDGETLVGKLDRAGFALASGSACSSAQPEPSHVLLAMGVPAELARGALRISLGPDNNEHDIERLLVTLADVVSALRNLCSVQAG